VRAVAVPIDPEAPAAVSGNGAGKRRSRGGVPAAR
jgi:hypothetical protein